MNIVQRSEKLKSENPVTIVLAEMEAKNQAKLLSFKNEQDTLVKNILIWLHRELVSYGNIKFVWLKNNSKGQLCKIYYIDTIWNKKKTLGTIYMDVTEPNLLNIMPIYLSLKEYSSGNDIISPIWINTDDCLMRFVDQLVVVLSNYVK